jgi:selenocysteine-specific elongation factor
MFVVGTAGHIDHGKSALVRTLTGIDPDRLPEEKARGMTIDLGFAWLTLPSGDSVGIVDVPGHERFIKNMVAGVGAIDAVIFVIAADDGWMPQTSEHLDILKLLGIKTGLVALTKVDLVDSEYLEMQKKDIAARLAGSFLERAPIIPFSTRANIGKREIIAALQDILQRHITRITYDSPRLYIDRSFTIKGIGTVVTGTLIEGELRTGQEMEICPSGVRSRIRSLQTHKQSIQVAVPGSRVAVGLTGLSTQEAPRGARWFIPAFSDRRIRLEYN